MADKNDDPLMTLPVTAVKRLAGRSLVSRIELLAGPTPHDVLSAAQDRMFLSLAQALKEMFSGFVVGQRTADGGTHLAVELLVIDPVWLMEQAHANQIQAQGETVKADAGPAGPAREAGQQTH